MEHIRAKQVHIDNIHEEAKTLYKDVLLKIQEMKETTIMRKDLDWEITNMQNKFFREQDWVEKFIKEVKATDNYIDKYLP
jgi:hypothetical protein